MTNTILVIDRYPNMLEAFHRFLSQEKYQVVTSDRLEEALMMMGVIQIDLIIMDTGKSFEIEAVNGLRNMREKNPYVPILLTTTHEDEMTDKEAKDLGAVDVFLKPFDPKELKRRVREIVSNESLH